MSFEEFKLDVFSKSAWIVIHQGLSISKSFQQRVDLKQPHSECLGSDTKVASCSSNTLPSL